MKKEEKKKKISDATLLRQYRDPTQTGSLGGVQRFAKSRGISAERARALLQRDLGYTLHKPTRRRFPTRPRVWARRAMGGRSGGSAEPGQPLSALRHRCVFEIRVGGTPQVQDGCGRDPSLRKGTETRPGTNPPQASKGRRQRILQQDLPRPDDAPRHSRLFHGRGHESNRTLKQRLYRYFTVENTLSFVSVLPEIVQG